MKKGSCYYLHIMHRKYLCQTSQLAEPLWTDRSIKSGTSVRGAQANLHFQKKNKNKTAGGVVGGGVGFRMVEHFPQILASEKRATICVCSYEECKQHEHPLIDAQNYLCV